MLSTDRKALVADSEVRLRFAAYGKHFDELHILVLSVGLGEGKEQIAPGVWIYSTRSVMKFLMHVDAFKIGVRIAKRVGVDVVISQDPFEGGEVCMRIAHKVGAKLYVQVHTDPLSPWFIKSTPKNIPRLGLMYRVLKRADGIRAVSGRVKRGLMSKVLDIPEPSVLPLVHGLAATSLEKKKPHCPFTILCMGRLEVEKHWHVAIEVLVEAHKSFPGAGIVFVGEGSMKRKLQALARRRGLEEFVYFAGWSTDISEWFAGAHCLLHTSSYEGYGRVLLEAALAKVPIVSTDVGAMGDVLRLGQDAFICPVDDVSCLAAGVRELMNNTYLREQMPRQAYDRAVAHIAGFKDPAKLLADDVKRIVTK